MLIDFQRLPGIGKRATQIVALHRGPSEIHQTARRAGLIVDLAEQRGRSHEILHTLLRRSTIRSDAAENMERLCMDLEIAGLFADRERTFD
jgi:hypothetical protein